MSLLTRRRFLRLTAVAAGGAIALGGYARFVELHWLELVRRRMRVRGLPPALEGATLAHLSDLHVGRTASAYVASVLERVRGLAPDLVVYTGDFITWRGPRVLDELTRLLAHAPRGRLGTWGSLGNHDYGPNWSHAEIAEAVVGRVSAAGIHVLRNERTTVEGLPLIGCDDLWANRFDPAIAFRDQPADADALVLSHNPDTVDDRRWIGRGWVLAGHTHGGQVRLPFVGPPILPVRNRRYAAGEVDLGRGRRLYVSRGVGHLLPVRFGVRPEVTLFTLSGAGP